MDNDAEQFERRSSHGNWWAHLISTAFGLALSFALQNPVMCAVVPYLFSVWKPFSTGMWLLHHDDDRRRAWICFSTYLAFGYLVGSVMAAGSMIVYTQTMLWIGQPIQDELIVATAMAAVFGLFATSGIGILGVIAAWARQQKIWVSPNLRNEVNDEFKRLARPTYDYEQGNHALFVIALSVCLPVLTTMSLLLGIVAAKPPFGFIDNVVLPFVILFLVPGILIALYAVLSNRIIARHPAECWGELIDGE